jgi:hypothetical protein
MIVNNGAERLLSKVTQLLLLPEIGARTTNPPVLWRAILLSPTCRRPQNQKPEGGVMPV